MSGVHNGVAANILRKQKKAYFVHCNAHSLDLALQDLTKESIAVHVAVNITKDIVNFVRRSPKRLILPRNSRLICLLILLDRSLCARLGGLFEHLR